MHRPDRFLHLLHLPVSTICTQEMNTSSKHERCCQECGRFLPYKDGERVQWEYPKRMAPSGFTGDLVKNRKDSGEKESKWVRMAFSSCKWKKMETKSISNDAAFVFTDLTKGYSQQIVFIHSDYKKLPFFCVFILGNIVGRFSIHVIFNYCEMEW